MATLTETTSPASGGTPTIPEGINDFSLLEAAQFYAGIGWAVHPIRAREKAPKLKNWPDHSITDVSPAFLKKHFGNGSKNNLAEVVAAPFFPIDLDSKADGGESVRQWLAQQPELAEVPRERTGGGAHLHVICHDVPEAVLALKSAPSVALTDTVDAELYLDGLNLVLAPSVHPTGFLYTWEVTGQIPEVSWADLQRWFGFAVPEPKRRGRPAKGKPWWAKWEQDLRTLDLTGVMEELGHLGFCISEHEGKWTVDCPWESEHTGGKGAGGSDTVIFDAPGALPRFKCLHAHCKGRGLEQLLDWAEAEKPGVVAARCTRRRAWSPGATGEDGRPQIPLPATGVPASAFAAELGGAIGPEEDLFLYGECVVEIEQTGHTGPTGDR